MGKKHNILVIDDEENTRLLIAEELLEAGYKVDQAASAEEARKKIESNSYDLVTLDIEMPGMNGVEFAGFFGYRPYECKILHFFEIFLLQNACNLYTMRLKAMFKPTIG